ncbi:Immunoglobulin superfamily member 11 [Liparis tanakae]|nr:Immunoglobulin superfamily member 11 [Liparis tanakae]
MQGTVAMRNISTSTSGLYQCTSSNVIGKSTCLLDLQVVTPQPQSVGLIAGTIATGVLAVIICSLLVAVTLFYWKNKNKYDEEEIPNEIRYGVPSWRFGQLQPLAVGLQSTKTISGS